MKTCLLYSGGLDSLIAWHYLDKPETLFVDLNHRYSNNELTAIQYLPPEPIIHTSFYGEYFEKSDAHIPGRNLLLGMHAAGSGFDNIYLVAQKGEQSIPDRTEDFFARTSEELTFHFERPIEFTNVFPHMTKVEMVAWYLENKLPVQDLFVSVSCYSFEGGHCGQCTSCFRKFVALTLNGITCSHIFSTDVIKWGYEIYGHRLDEYEDCRKIDLIKLFKENGYDL